MNVKLKYDAAKLIKICQTNFIIRLSLFGSVLRDDFDENSDVDVLIEFEKDKTPSLFGLVHIVEDLSKLFGGRKVDLTSYNSLRGRLKKIILKEHKILYEQEYD